MGSFVYMIARDDADIIEEKRPEFEERLEKVFNAAGMMEQEHLILFGKGIRAIRTKSSGIGIITVYSFPSSGRLPLNGRRRQSRPDRQKRRNPYRSYALLVAFKNFFVGNSNLFLGRFARNSSALGDVQYRLWRKRHETRNPPVRPFQTPKTPKHFLCRKVFFHSSLLSVS